ncbi:MAG: SDR family oxidoreductase [Chloroflexota bacterium]
MSQVVFITGGTKGIGLVIARQLSEQGYTVYGTSRKPQQSTAHGIHLLPLDVTDAEAVTRTVDQIIDEAGKIDIVINNAGYDLYGTAEDTTMQELHAQMDTNFYGAVRIMQAVLPHMRRQRSGKIINISSIGGLMSLPLNSAYAASKYALEGYTESLRYEMLPFNVYVSLVEPGQVWTETLHNAFPTTERQTIFDVDAAAEKSRERGANTRLKPVHVAATVSKIVAAPRPKLRYASGSQVPLVVAMKRYMPGRMFESMVMGQFVRPFLKS